MIHYHDIGDSNTFSTLDINKERKTSSTFIPGMGVMARRIDAHGGPPQQNRMIRDKRRSLDRAVKYSYQAAQICKPGFENQVAPALINPNKLKQDYDDKILSVGFEFGYQPGDVFEWMGTKTHWLIYLQDLTELAYFRGDIRKCSHEITWEDEDGIHSTYAAIRGPVETRINYIQKHNISVDTPNYSLNILIPQSESAIKYFQRYSKFYLSGSDIFNICWRVEAIDWISTPGILEVNAVEYYRNETEDNIEDGVVGSLISKPIDPNSPAVNDTIVGETFIKPKKEYDFTYVGNTNGSWSVDKNIPVKLIPNGKSVKICWTDTYSGQFDLYYGTYKKIIVVESLF